MGNPQFASLINKNEHFDLYRWQSQSVLSDETHSTASVPLLVHGLGGCLAWMEPFIQALLQFYPVVYGMDSPYYGPNPKQVGHISDGSILTASVTEAIKAVFVAVERPVLLIGLSLGGLISTHALARAHEKLPLKGLVLISPAFKGSSESFQPKMYAQVLLNNMLRFSDKPINIPYDLASITSDLQQMNRLKQATSCVQALTSASFLELLKLTMSRKGFDRLHYPLLLLRAEKDAICDVRAMDAIWKKWPYGQKQLSVFSNVKHDLVLEPIISQLAHHIFGWNTYL